MPRSRLWLAALSVLYLIPTLYRVAARPFWYDELFTFHLVRLGSFDKIQEAIAAGLDLNPPLLYLGTAAAQWVFGTGELGTRMPAVIGFLVLIVSIHRFVARRLPEAYALQAAALVAVSGAYEFSQEARSYGMVLGWTGVAMVAWQGRRLILLAVAVAGALLTHCYALLLLPPLYAGELVRTVSARRIDLPAWLSLVAGSSAALTYIPLVRMAYGSQLAGPIFDPTPLRLLGTYLDLTVPALPVLLASLAAIVVFCRLGAPQWKARIGWLREAIPPAEWTLLGLMLCAPAMAFLLSSIGRGGYFTRYGLGAAVAGSILFAMASALLAGREWRGGMALPAIAMVWFAGSFLWQMRTPAKWPADSATLATWRTHADAPPLVVADGQTFFELNHYLEPAAASRLVFLRDRDSALRYMHTDCYDSPAPLLAKWFGTRGQVVDASDFLARHRRFLVYGLSRTEHQWLLSRMKDESASVKILGKEDRRQLAEVTQSAAEGDASGSLEKGLKSVPASNTSTPSARFNALTTR